MSDELPVINCKQVGKTAIIKKMRENYKRYYGIRVNSEELSRQYDIIVQSIKDTIFENGSVMVEGLVGFKAETKDESTFYSPIELVTKISPEHNTVRAWATNRLKQEVRDLKYKYVTDKKTKKKNDGGDN